MRFRLSTILILILLACGASRADDIGYVNCSNKSESIQVLSKAANSPPIASLSCGERFVVLLSGEIFSQIQTKDGKVGYIYSSSISHDLSMTSLDLPGQKSPTPAVLSQPTSATLPGTNPVPNAPPGSAPLAASSSAPMPVPPTIPGAAPDAVSTPATAQARPCLIVRQAEGHRFRNSMIAGALTGGVGFALGAASGGAKYEYVDSFKMIGTKPKYDGKELEKLQQGGIHVVTVSKKATSEEIEGARGSCKQ